MPSQTTEPALTAAKSLAGKYLTFVLHGESFAIDALQVREIIRLTTITAVPQMPAFARGVINLRGKIIPVLDLRLRFGFSEAENTQRTCIIVVQVSRPDGRVAPMGLIVDGVEEAVNIAAGDIEEAPHFGSPVSVENILGMAKVKGRVVALLEIDKVLTGTAATHL